jgi:hypothetical protein
VRQNWRRYSKSIMTEEQNADHTTQHRFCVGVGERSGEAVPVTWAIQSAVRVARARRLGRVPLVSHANIRFVSEHQNPACALNKFLCNHIGQPVVKYRLQYTLFYGGEYLRASKCLYNRRENVFVKLDVMYFDHWSIDLRNHPVFHVDLLARLDKLDTFSCQ